MGFNIENFAKRLPEEKQDLPMTLKAVLFDFNGIIINDEAIHEALVGEILLGENLRVRDRDYKEVCLGRSDRACLTKLLALHGRVVNEATLTQLISLKSRAYHQKLEALETLPIYPIQEVLMQFQDLGVAMGIVTGAIRSEVEWILERAGLASYFSVLVAGDDIRRSKPDPYGYLLAVERLNQQNSTLNLQPNHCLAIEDTPAGIQAAKKAGMQVVGVANTYPFHMLQRQADWTVDDLSELELERVQTTFS
ncbi:HAD family phosphatase [Lusitaniella coriacea LEGE 07167]